MVLASGQFLVSVEYLSAYYTLSFLSTCMIYVLYRLFYLFDLVI